nr:NADH dehydrogenase subunit 2 [Aulostomus maculatus]
MNTLATLTLGSSLLLGTLITVSSSHWFYAWLGLEINTLAILPLLAAPQHARAIEATTKYFLSQATASATILFAAITNTWLTGQWDILQMTHPIPATMLTAALALKMGLAPLHTWVPEVLQGLDLNTGLLVATWQKLAPFTLILQTHQSNSPLLISLGLISIFIGGWAGLNQTQLRKILAYSSVAHLGWAVLIVQFSPQLATIAFATYLAMTLSTFLLFKQANSTSINSLATSWTTSPMLATIAPLILLSLAGLPPLTGFMPKWLVLQELIKQDLGFIATLAAMAALLSLYYYLRLSYAMALTISPNTLQNVAPWRLRSPALSLPLAISTCAVVLLLPLTPSLLTLLPI